MWSTGRVHFGARRYLRDGSSICIARPHFIDVVSQFLNNGLHWFWTSDRRDGRAPRALTRLTQAAAADLSADFAERDKDQFGRFVSLFGVQQIPERPDLDWLRAELRRLVDEEEGDLQIVAIRPDDGNEDYVQVRHQPSLSATKMLHACGLDATATFKDRNYQALRGMTLERLFDPGNSM